MQTHTMFIFVCESFSSEYLDFSDISFIFNLHRPILEIVSEVCGYLRNPTSNNVIFLTIKLKIYWKLATTTNCIHRNAWILILNIKTFNIFSCTQHIYHSFRSSLFIKCLSVRFVNRRSRILNWIVRSAKQSSSDSNILVLKWILMKNWSRRMHHAYLLFYVWKNKSTRE